MGQVASKAVVAVLLALLVAKAMVALDRMQLAWLRSATPSQVVARQLAQHQHGFQYHFLLMLFSIGFAVGIVEAVSWCIRWPFIVWSQRRKLPGFPVLDIAPEVTGK